MFPVQIYTFYVFRATKKQIIFTKRSFFFLFHSVFRLFNPFYALICCFFRTGNIFFPFGRPSVQQLKSPAIAAATAGP